MNEQYDEILASIKDDLISLLKVYGSIPIVNKDLQFKYLKLDLLRMISQYKSKKLIFEYDFKFVYSDNKIVIKIVISFTPCIYDEQRFVEVEIDLSKI